MRSIRLLSLIVFTSGLVLAGRSFAEDDLPPPPPPMPTNVATGKGAPPDSLTPEQRIIWTVQHLSVREIDSTQVPMRFDHWFWNAVGADAYVSWEVNDCGEQTGNPADSTREWPMCVQAMAEWQDGRKAFLMIAVGSGHEVRGKPELAFASAGMGATQRTFFTLAQFMKYAQIEGKPGTAKPEGKTDPAAKNPATPPPPQKPTTQP